MIARYESMSLHRLKSKTLKIVERDNTSLFYHSKTGCYKALTRKYLIKNNIPFNGVSLDKNVLIDVLNDDEDVLRPEKKRF